MSTYVLVHGAWHGGWCWQRVVSGLQRHGHRVFAPTLSGVSDRRHLLSPDVGLDTHAQDVRGLIEAWDLTDVVLVGHSYGGQVVTEVAARSRSRIGRAVYLDAFVADTGERAIDLLPDEVAAHYRESVAGPGFGWLIPPRSLQVLGVTEQSDLDWLTPRLSPHPWKTYVDPVSAALPGDLPASYVDCTDWMAVFAPYAQRAKERGYDVHELLTGHEAMVTAPAELADVLHGLAA
ncbi:alpha/beta fold hydrolase [Labedaea rhizosphaerae]|uniref:Alpha/beta hydrolase family protein n=1 Tax=Labedaea rhizosphaerae TaxID=598644 RepID=A0A4R6S4Z4_LABRH|nr:alpha/beta fold hydrolase [Labedaea rhizosphaerae]TDP94802.1 alpha/beta hydrolase family protein [Labedaea rhizosphaerae]